MGTVCRKRHRTGMVTQVAAQVAMQAAMGLAVTCHAGVLCSLPSNLQCSALSLQGWGGYEGQKVFVYLKWGFSF